MAGWSKIPHSVYDTDRLTFEEKAMLAFLMDRQNKFNTDWFGFSDSDFIKAGYGRNVSRWKPTRDRLIQLGLISYKKQRGKKSQYKVNDVDSILEQETVEIKPKKEASNKRAEELVNWYGILRNKDNDEYFNNTWRDYFNTYEEAKSSAKDYLINNYKSYKGWLM